MEGKVNDCVTPQRKKVLPPRDIHTGVNDLWPPFGFDKCTGRT